MRRSVAANRKADPELVQSHHPFLIQQRSVCAQRKDDFFAVLLTKRSGEPYEIGDPMVVNQERLTPVQVQGDLRES